MRPVPGQLLKSGDYTHLAPGEGCRFHNECNGDVMANLMWADEVQRDNPSGDRD